KGDTCDGVAQLFNVSKNSRFSLNPKLNCVDSDVFIGKSLCLQGRFMNANGTKFAGVGGRPQTNVTLTPTPISTCNSTVTVGFNQTCVDVAKLNNVAVTYLGAWNTGLDCWSLPEGSSVCALAIPPTKVTPILSGASNANGTISAAPAPTTTTATTTTTAAEVVAADPNKSRCGWSWQDANGKCGTLCTYNGGCSNGETCFGQLDNTEICTNPSAKAADPIPVVQQPDPSPAPAPAPQPVVSSGGSGVDQNECIALFDQARQIYYPSAPMLTYSARLAGQAQLSVNYNAGYGCCDSSCHILSGPGTDIAQVLYCTMMTCGQAYDGWVTQEASYQGGHWRNIVGWPNAYPYVGCANSAAGVGGI
ncbi:hypothetical protein HDU99_008778, partial [Rhizoclosmatium hyalinum]